MERRTCNLEMKRDKRCTRAACALNNRVLTETETTILEANMKRIYKVIPLANVEVIHRSLRVCRREATGMALPEHRGCLGKRI